MEWKAIVDSIDDVEGCKILHQDGECCVAQGFFDFEGQRFDIEIKIKKGE